MDLFIYTIIFIIGTFFGSFFTLAVYRIPRKEDIQRAEESKEKRSILLQSASTSLTEKFKEWWNQGEYRFRFEADGEYFRIWVSDQIRTDEVALELRSTGLQWFLSFYLIFLVESQEQHKNAILLLDEAGLTLHPMAQKDLPKFFNKLIKLFTSNISGILDMVTSSAVNKVAQITSKASFFAP